MMLSQETMFDPSSVIKNLVQSSKTEVRVGRQEDVDGKYSYSFIG